MFSLFGRFSLIASVCVTLACAQSFSEFQRVQSASFSQYKDEKDNAFAKYLQEQWQEYQAFVSAPLYPKEKPKSIPTIMPKEVAKVGPNLVINIKKSSKSKAKQAPKPKKKGYAISFDLFGTSVGFESDKKIKNAIFYPHTQQGIINFFSVLAASDYESIIHQLRATCKEMNLNDWGVYTLINRLANSLYDSDDEAKLFSWFLFNKMGYRVKVGLDKNKHIVLLHAIRGMMYATPNYLLSGEKYYVVSQYNKKSSGNIYTYTQEYPEATKVLDFSLKTLPNLAKSLQHKNLMFKEYAKEYKISFRYNENLIEYMKDYPQVDYKVFFNAPLEYETYSDIAKGIKRYTDNKKASEALNFILRFVQKSFQYERDDEQFGREKVMFAQEALCYNKSDCDDRAVLYARLVKDLFGISVVGVKYKDHMSTALYVPMRGDSVKVGQKRYVLADPTYINASLGQSIPKYRSIMPDSFVYVK